MHLKDSDISYAAELLGVDEAVVRAVIDVESNGSGFLPDGRPVILFEPHLFSRFTGHKYDTHYPELSRRHWDRSGYGRAGAYQWNKLEQAAILDPQAAYRAASYGLFQILGDNYKECGFSNVHDFVAFMSESERNHLIAFCRFCQRYRLDHFLREKDWPSFARGYNGPAFAAHDYHGRLRRAYEKRAQVRAHNTHYGESKVGKARVSAASGLHMRSGPGTEHSIVTSLPRGTEVFIFERGDDWSLVSHGNGRNVGYVATRYLSRI